MMDASGRKPWIRAAILVGVVYFVVGMVFAALAKPAVSDQMRFMWRLAPWVASAAGYAAHISYEHFRLHNSARITAVHAAMAVALGAFLLALAANIHDLGSASGYRPRMLIALVAWPLLTAVPAFLVALAVAAVLARLPAKRGVFIA
jgi:vacuolar-type H+-ATPase subunit I/STV1